MQISDINAESLVQNLHEGVVVHAADTSVLYANPRALRLLRLTKNQMLGKDAFDPHWRFLESDGSVMPVDRYPVQQVKRLLKPVYSLEIGICDSGKDHVTWVLCNAYPEFDAAEQLIQIVVTFVDITNKKTDIPFDRLVEITNDLVVITTATSARYDEQRIIYVNQSFINFTGFGREHLLGKSPKLLFAKADAALKLNNINDALERGLPIRTQLQQTKPDGELFWVDVNIVPLNNDFGEVAYYAAIERDVSAAKQYEADLKELTIRDPLTSLLNRRGFWELAKQHLLSANRHRREVCFVMLDIDHFKKVNDAYGHAAGDKVITEFSRSMMSFFRETDLLARIGGEEFAILLPDAELTQAKDRLQKFCELIKQTPVKCADTNVVIHFTVSIGITNTRCNNTKLDALLKAADQALYCAKNTGRNKVCFQALESSDTVADNP